MPDCKLITGDCLEVMKEMEANSIDTIITDPPYGLSQHSPEDVADCLRAWINGEPYRPNKKGFMGKAWDAWVPGPEVWRECFRVLKPGGHMLAFAGTRSMDLMCMAIRLSGFELRDSIGYAHEGGGAPLMAWVQGQGFPKSHSISAAIDKAAGAEREVIGQRTVSRDYARNGKTGDMAISDGPVHSTDIPITAPATEAAKQFVGYGTALKPAWEPILLAMKGLDKGSTFAENAIRHGVAGLNIEGGRIGWDEKSLELDTLRRKSPRTDITGGNYVGGKPGEYDKASESPSGRWPANVILDEEAARQLDEQSGTLTSGKPLGRKHTDVDGRNTYGSYHGEYEHTGFGDSGGASRFFYVAKASRSERNAGLEGMPERDGALRDNGRFNSGGRTQIDGEWVETGSTPLPKQNHHPTVKPVKLMEYLCRLTATPTGGTVLDPFCGSGSTGVACMRTGRHFIGIDISAEYIEIAQRRIEAETRQPTLFDV